MTKKAGAYYEITISGADFKTAYHLDLNYNCKSELNQVTNPTFTFFVSVVNFVK